MLVIRTLFLCCLFLPCIYAARVAAESKPEASPPIAGRVLKTGGSSDELAPGTQIIASSTNNNPSEGKTIGKGRAQITNSGKHRSYASANAGQPLGGGETLTKVYKFRKNGVAAFADAAPRDAAFEVLTYGCFACNVNSAVDWYSTKLFPDTFSAHIQAASQTYQVEPALVRAVIHAESGFNPAARSGAGAMGLMQLMPGTAKEMGVSNAYEAPQNIVGGVKYLAYLLGIFKGDISLATAAYNAGPNNVSKYQGIPPFAETQAYVKRVKILLERYRAQG